MERDIGEEILKSLKEVHAHMKGDEELEVQSFDPPDVKALRKKLDMTQQEFSMLFGIKIHTLRGWEQGRRTPEGPARVLLRIVEREPEAALRALHGDVTDTDNRSAGR